MMPSFGYLLGLIPCAYLAGRVARDPGAGLPRMMAGAGAGILALYLIGVPYLYFMVNAFSGAMTFGSALWSGMIMFLPIDIAKGLLASIVDDHGPPQASPRGQIAGINRIGRNTVGRVQK